MKSFTALEYLKIDIANNMGLDKKSWEERLDWFNTNENQLENLIDKADSPALYYAGVKAYRNIQRDPDYINTYPISLDATSSGVQILACLTGDRLAAMCCNVLSTGSREDCYTSIYKKFAKLVGNNPLITRDKVKKAIMTSCYGSQATPRELFGDYIQVFEQIMSQECPYVWALNKYLLKAWNSSISEYGWVMPDNFHVHVKVYEKIEEEFAFMDKAYKFIHEENKPSIYGRAYSANCAHSIDSLFMREICAMAMHDPEKINNIKSLLNQKKYNLANTTKENKDMVSSLVRLSRESGFLSARILDYLDEGTISLVPRDALQEILDNIPAKPFEVIGIHDCYRVLPNYGNDIRRLYIFQLYKLARSNMLEFILTQLLGTKITINKGDKEMYKDVLFSEYALS